MNYTIVKSFEKAIETSAKLAILTFSLQQAQTDPEFIEGSRAPPPERLTSFSRAGEGPFKSISSTFAEVSIL